MAPPREAFIFVKTVKSPSSDTEYISNCTVSAETKMCFITFYRVYHKINVFTILPYSMLPFTKHREQNNIYAKRR